MTFADALTFGTALLVLINPPSILPAYTDIVSAYEVKIQRSIAARTSISLAVFMLILIWLGQFILDALDIEIGALQVAGGLILLRGSIRMVDAADRALPEDELKQTESESWQVVSVVPLAIPLTVGGGTIALIVATTGQFNRVLDLMAMSLVCVLIALMMAAIYFFAGPISRTLGPIGMRILGRIGGIVLMAISVQLLTTGISALVPVLA